MRSICAGSRPHWSRRPAGPIAVPAPSSSLDVVLYRGENHLNTSHTNLCRQRWIERHGAMIHQLLQECLNLGPADFGRYGVFLAQLRADSSDLLRGFDQLPYARAHFGDTDMMRLFPAHHDELAAHFGNQPVTL